MKNAHRAASSEWRAAMLAKTDYPETHVALGGRALVMRDLRSADSAFREAVALDPQLEDAWTMIVRIRDAIGDRQGALKALKEGLEVNPFSLNLFMLEKSLSN